MANSTFPAKQPKQSSAHPEAQIALVALGERLRKARVARDVTLVEMAKRIGIQPGTLGRLEKGAPGVSVEALALALWQMGLLNNLDAIAAPENDPEGQRLADLRRPTRARGGKSLAGSAWDALHRL